MNPPKSDDTEWFAQEVHPHESSLRAYLRGAFPRVRDVDDVVQQSYLRIWKARAAHPIVSARAFLFTIAKRLAVDSLRREGHSPVEPLGDLSRLSVVEEGPSVQEAISYDEKVRLLGQAIGALPSRCREIVYLHKIQGVPQREVAERLGLSPKTVENQMARGLRKCEEFFRRRGIETF